MKGFAKEFYKSELLDTISQKSCSNVIDDNSQGTRGPGRCRSPTVATGSNNVADIKKFHKKTTKSCGKTEIATMIIRDPYCFGAKESYISKSLFKENIGAKDLKTSQSSPK